MSENNKKLSTESYKGVRDFYPEDLAIQNYIFSVWRKTAESFGYVEYNASPLEPTELYKAKSGEEIINEQTYSFKDRGDRDVTLRPEMTPTVARMIAGRRRELKFPQRWYSIPNLFRYEKPQRGRLREHFQLNCDMFGVSGIEAEVEMISMAHQIMKNFGIPDDKFEIRISSRKLLFEIYKPILKDVNLWPEVCRFIDKRSKLSEEKQEEGNEKYFTRPFSDGDTKKHTSTSIDELQKRLQSRGISTIFKVDLMRGFDYYTDIIFEIFDKNPENNRSLFGGGRYDNLLSIFGEEPLPTVGFGMGDVTIRDVLETYGLLPEFKSTTDLLICPINQTHFEEAERLAELLRKENINVAVNFSNKKVGDQVAKADVEKIPFVIVLGDDEVKNKVYKIKKLETKEESTGDIQDIITVIQKS